MFLELFPKNPQNHFYFAQYTIKAPKTEIINPKILKPLEASFWSPNPNQVSVSNRASYTQITPPETINSPIILKIILTIFVVCFKIYLLFEANIPLSETFYIYISILLANFSFIKLLSIIFSCFSIKGSSEIILFANFCTSFKTVISSKRFAIFISGKPC